MGEDFSLLLSNMAQLEIEINTTDEIIIVDEGKSNEAQESVDNAPSGRSLRFKRDDSLHRTRNRKIQRPRKNAGNMHFETEKEVKNFYVNVNKKFKSVKPIPLETIYEKDETLSEEDEGKLKTGKDTGRTHKRTLAICDGLNITKALKEKRKALIKKHLGNKKKPNKIALAKFMEYFKERVAVHNDKT